MKTNKVMKFREILAEQGTELTIDQAKELYFSALKLIKRSKKLSQLDLWEAESTNINGMTEEEKQQAISLYQYLRDLR